MSLRAIGKTADVRSENRTYPSGDPYVETRVWVQTSKTKILEMVLDKDFPKSDLPRVDEEVDLEVNVRAFSLRSGGVGTSYVAVGRRFDLLKASQPLKAAQ